MFQAMYFFAVVYHKVMAQIMKCMRFLQKDSIANISPHICSSFLLDVQARQDYCNQLKSHHQILCP